MKLSRRTTTSTRRAIYSLLVIVTLALHVRLAQATPKQFTDIPVILARLNVNIERCRASGAELWLQKLRELKASPAHSSNVERLLIRYEPRVAAVKNDARRIGRLLSTIDLVRLEKNVLTTCGGLARRKELSSLAAQLKALDLSEACSANPELRALRQIIANGESLEEKRSLLAERVTSITKEYGDTFRLLSEKDTDSNESATRAQASPQKVEQMLRDIKSIDGLLDDSCQETEHVRLVAKQAEQALRSVPTDKRETANTQATEAPATEKRMPNLQGKRLDSKLHELTALSGRLEMYAGRKANTPEEALIVLEQTPPPGAPITADTVARLTVSIPMNQLLTIPRFTDIAVTEAVELANTLGLETDTSSLSSVSDAVVISQEPVAGSRVQHGSRILFKTSSREPRVRNELSVSN